MTKPNIISIKQLRHRDENQIGLYFQYNTTLIEIAKRIEGMQWSQSNKCWYIRNNPNNLRKIYAAYKGKAWIEKGSFFEHPEEKQDMLRKPAEMPKRLVNDLPNDYTSLLMRRRYSKNTIRTYQHYFSAFINHFPGLSIHELTEDHIRKYLTTSSEKRKYQ